MPEPAGARCCQLRLGHVTASLEGTVMMAQERILADGDCQLDGPPRPKLAVSTLRYGNQALHHGGGSTPSGPEACTRDGGIV